MGKGRRKRQWQQADGDGQPPAKKEKGQQHHGENIPDPPSAVIAVHPAGVTVAVAVGPEIRVYDSRLQELKTLKRQPEEGDKVEPNTIFIRSLAFDASGNYLVAACDDKNKAVLLWDCTTWEQLQALKTPKRVSNVALTNDGAYILAADKFGDVHVAPTKLGPNAAPGVPELLLGHFCSILTSLSLSPDGRFVVSTDRDRKARVSLLPAEPLKGAHEIQSYCLGHTDFVTSSAFVAQGGKELLVTGGADGSVRLWDHLSGRLLSTWELPQVAQQRQEEDQQQQQAAAAAAQEEELGSKAGQQQATEGEGEEGAGPEAEAEPSSAAGEEEGGEAGEGDTDGAAADDEGENEAGGVGEGRPAEQQQEEERTVPAVVALAASPDGLWVAAVVEDRDEVALLRVDWEAQALVEAGWRALDGLHLPTALAFGPGNKLWAIGGPPKADSTAAFLACATVTGPEGSLQQSDGAAQALEALRASDGSESAALAAAVETRAMRAARVTALRKRKYQHAEIERRKRLRRDVRAKAAAAAAAAAAAQQQQQ